MRALLDFFLALFSRNPETVPEVLETPKLPPEIQYKKDSVRLKEEHVELLEQNKPLHELLEDLNAYVYGKFNKTLTVTMIFRTEAEQAELYKNNAKYQKKAFRSPHQFWQGVDIRSSVFTKTEIESIENYLNSRWNARNYYKWTAKCHTIGHGEHFHIQFLKV